ncbi:MAG: AAA family ATPase [Parafilimonas terrae]|nr:AAA family ATPase [Parafilimonas terrae]
MASGRTLPYYADFTLAAHALAIGESETRFVRDRAAAAVRRREASRAARSGKSSPGPSAPEPEERHAPDARPAGPGAGHGSVLVCPAITAVGKARDAIRGYEHVIGCEVPLVEVGDLADRRSALLAEFPYAAEAIDTVLGDLVGKEFVRLPGYLIEGPPGAGKSRFVRRLGEALGVGVYRVDATGDSGASIAGTERRWWSTEPCRPFMAIARHRHANPFLLVDEIDKAPTRSDYGRVWDALLQLVEQENASRYPDPSLQQDIDIHWVSIVCLANDAGRLPGPLLDRFRVIRFPEPGPQHLEALVASSLAEIALERGLHPRFLPPPDGVELRALRRRWRGGSVRRLRRAVEAVLRAREKLRGEPLQ